MAGRRDVVGCGGEKFFEDVFGEKGSPFVDFCGKIGDFGAYFGLEFFIFYFWMMKFLYFCGYTNIFLCTYTGMWPKIVIFAVKKGSPSEDVFSNAILHTTDRILRPDTSY